MEAMQPSNSRGTWATGDDIIDAVLFLMAETNINKEQLAEKLKPHVGKFSRSTLYRRLEHPGDVTLDEMRGLAAVFDVPVDVLAAGKFRTMRWWIDRHDGNGGGDGNGGSVVTARYRPSRLQALRAA